MKQSCENCRYFLRNDQKAIDFDQTKAPSKKESNGVCRQKPPSASVGMHSISNQPMIVSIWPQVSSIEWCGEWNKDYER